MQFLMSLFNAIFIIDAHVLLSKPCPLCTCAACKGLNAVALFGLLASSLGSALVLLATPPAANAVFRLIIDYMQLASLVMTPVAGKTNTLWMRAFGDSTKHTKADCVHALKGLVLPRASHSCEIALVGSSRLRCTLAVAPALFAHAVVTEANTSSFSNPSLCVTGLCCVYWSRSLRHLHRA